VSSGKEPPSGAGPARAPRPVPSEPPAAVTTLGSDDKPGPTCGPGLRSGQSLGEGGGTGQALICQVLPVPSLPDSAPSSSRLTVSENPTAEKPFTRAASVPAECASSS